MQFETKVDHKCYCYIQYLIVRGVELGAQRRLAPSYVFMFWGVEPPSYFKQTLIQSNKWQAYEILVHVPGIINITTTLFLKRRSSNGLLYVELCHNIKSSSFQRSYFSTFYRGEICVKPSVPQKIKSSIWREIECLCWVIMPCHIEISMHILA